MHIKGHKKKREARLVIWTLLPLLFWQFLPLCAAGPLACYRFYPSRQEANTISSHGFHDVKASLRSHVGKTSQGGAFPHCHTGGEAERTASLLLQEGREKICCGLAGKRHAIVASFSPQVEKPLAREGILALDPLVSLRGPERLCSDPLLYPTHTLPIYLLDSALLI